MWGQERIGEDNQAVYGTVGKARSTYNTALPSP